MTRRRNGGPGICWEVMWTGILCGAMLARSVSAQAGDFVWGVNGHPLTAYPGIPISVQLDFLRDLGLRSYRVNISDIAQLPALKELVASAKSRQIDILPVLTPPLDLAKEPAGSLYTKARDFAVTIVSALKDDVRVWELGNEEENFAIIRPCEMQDDGQQYNCAWGPAGGVGPLDYYGPRWSKVSALLRGLSDGTHAVDTSLQRAIGTAGWGHTGAFERMQADGLEWDISVWHMYGDDPEEAFKLLAKLKRPIWVTEFNAANIGQGGEIQQAAGLAAAIERLHQFRAAYNIQAAHIYELLDETYWMPGYEAKMGLLVLERRSEGGGWSIGRPKAAYDTVKRLIGGK